VTRRKAGLLGALLILSAPAHAQMAACTLPDRIPAPRPAGPGASEPRRIVPTAAYTLAMSWSPQICDRAGRSDDYQCDTSRNRFGFVLHGLWPDGQGGNGRNIAVPRRCFRRRSSGAICAPRLLSTCSSMNGPSTAPA
jgi:ribonuclease I